MGHLSRRNFIEKAAALTGLSSLAGTAKDRGGQGEKVKETYPSYLKLHRDGTLARRAKELTEYYTNCRLCPRDCRVDRTKGQVGKCQAPAAVKVSSAFPHFGEEPELVGRSGSGTIFFSHCGLRCVYCQNFDISIEGTGVTITERRLAETMLKMQSMGCHNVNLVTPTHYLPSILKALNLAVPLGLKIPLVYNTSGFEYPEIIEKLEGVVDIYLPDFKYADPAMAARYSSEAYSYPYYARLSLKEMFRQVGILSEQPRGIARRGLMIRHLVLPNRVSGTREILKFVAEELDKGCYVNIMRQYRPEHRARDFPQISRRLTASEYAEALKWAKELGLTRLGR
jgi:putative pyruvate formate lyase activating enzyme